MRQSRITCFTYMLKNKKNFCCMITIDILHPTYTVMEIRNDKLFKLENNISLEQTLSEFIKCQIQVTIVRKLFISSKLMAVRMGGKFVIIFLKLAENMTF